VGLGAPISTAIPVVSYRRRSRGYGGRGSHQKSPAVSAFCFSKTNLACRCLRVFFTEVARFAAVETVKRVLVFAVLFTLDRGAFILDRDAFILDRGALLLDRRHFEYTERTRFCTTPLKLARVSARVQPVSSGDAGKPRVDPLAEHPTLKVVY
ncbi:unnamed protein product, partial [Laminaria digitata]